MANLTKIIAEIDFYRLNIHILPLCERNLKKEEVIWNEPPVVSPVQISQPQILPKIAPIIIEKKPTVFKEKSVIPRVKKEYNIKNGFINFFSKFKNKKVKVSDNKVAIPSLPRILGVRPGIKLDFGKLVPMFRNGLLSLVRFSAVSAMIFIISFVVINFSAYKQIIAAKFSEMATNGKTAVTDIELTDKKKNTEPPLPATVVRDTAKLKYDVPALDLSVAPPDNRIIIPKINKNVPIVETSATNLLKKEWTSLEKDILADLQNGVVHFPGTAKPGEIGNAFITGHSSYYPWDKGKYKDVFALLSKMEVGDDFYIYYNQRKIHYKIDEKKVVKPDQMDVLKQTDDFRVTLMTCVPVGTNLSRLILIGKEV